MTKLAWFVLGAGAAVSLFILGCGRVRAGGVLQAVSIVGPPGYQCFAIMNGDQVAGGSCTKE